MNVVINSKDFKSAVNELFRRYGVTENEILDFNQVSDNEFEFIVSKTLDSELKLNQKVDSLIKSGNFKSTNTAFICNDGVAHTPSGSTLFDKIKELIGLELIPICGFDNLIDSLDICSNLSESNCVVLDNNSALVMNQGTLNKYNIKGITTAKVDSNIHKISIQSTDLDNVSNKLSSVNYPGLTINKSDKDLVIEFSDSMKLSDFYNVLNTIRSVNSISKFRYSVQGNNVLIGDIK